MAPQIHDLVTSYIKAVGDHRLDVLPAMLEPDAEFIVGDIHLRGAEAPLPDAEARVGEPVGVARGELHLAALTFFGDDDLVECIQLQSVLHVFAG